MKLRHQFSNVDRPPLSLQKHVSADRGLHHQSIISSDTKLWKPRLIDGQREVCLGEVVSFDMESSKIKVLFCRDGDVEHISKDNVIKIV